MSASDIPYQLRPNKFIDRQVFLDLLSRLLPHIGPENCAYVSMGGRHMVDHAAIYRRLGISNLLSFDRDQQVVCRQNFNRPIAQTICREMESGNIPGQLDAILDEFSSAENVVLWLDYTDPSARLSQLQELVETLKSLRAKDIVRITMNAHVGTIGAPNNWKDRGYKSPAAARCAKLRGQLGDLLPNEITAVDEHSFPYDLSKSIKLAVSKAQYERADVRFELLLLTTYKDGQRMLTASLRVVEPPLSKNRATEIDSWPFRSRNWSDVLHIDAPDLSLREKHKIDQYLGRSPGYILDRLNFLLAEDREESIRAIKSYKRLHRYYPAFHHIES